MCGNHTREQLTNWVMSKDSVASCFIKDVLSMSESGHAGVPYYFLGRVPCRSVSLVAIVVGTAEYESRIVYTLDDGTGTIECAFRPGEGKPETKTNEARDVLPLPRKPTDGPASTSSQPPPLIPVGSVVTVQGKVRAKRDSRDLQGETIVRCRGLREELEHWQRVTALHKNYYFLPERFVIPPLSSVPNAVAAQDVPRTPKSTKVIASLASTPSTHSTTSSSTTSSPAKSSEDASLQPRLRHPSRLRTRDLTENTFRIYVKHFMDNLRYLNFVPRSRESDLEEEDSDADSIAAAIDQTPRTPTKKRPAAPGDERTPRLLSRRDGALITPRPRPRPHSASRLDRSGHGDDDDSIVFGCTLSFLLRVPELANLACRVVKAEARRRERTRQSQPQSGAASSLDSSAREQRRAVASSMEGSLPKVKRLFSWAIRKLYQDGSIIMWDGPTLPVPELDVVPDSSTLYRSSRLDGVSSGPSRLGSRHGGTQPADDSMMDELSDPPSDEEAYASLSTAYLATQVEQVIRSLTRRRAKKEITYLGPAISRRRLFPLPGPTKEDITTHLRRGDDRWKRINGWAVQEALEWLRDNGRAWCISGDNGPRWELCE